MDGDGDLRWKAELTSLSPHISPQLDTIMVKQNIDPNLETAATFRDTFGALDLNGDGILSLAESGLATLSQLYAYDENDDQQVTLADLLELTVGPVGVATPVYVNFANAGTESGTLAEPFDTLVEGAVFVADGGTVSITSGSSSETIYIDKDITLTASGGKATLGAAP